MFSSADEDDGLLLEDKSSSVDVLAPLLAVSSILLLRFFADNRDDLLVAFVISVPLGGVGVLFLAFTR